MDADLILALHFHSLYVIYNYNLMLILCWLLTFHRKSVSFTFKPAQECWLHIGLFLLLGSMLSYSISNLIIHFLIASALWQEVCNFVLWTSLTCWTLTLLGYPLFHSQYVLLLHVLSYHFDHMTVSIHLAVGRWFCHSSKVDLHMISNFLSFLGNSSLSNELLISSMLLHFVGDLDLSIKCWSHNDSSLPTVRLSHCPIWSLNQVLRLLFVIKHKITVES